MAIGTNPAQDGYEKPPPPPPPPPVNIVGECDTKPRERVEVDVYMGNPPPADEEPMPGVTPKPTKGADEEQHFCHQCRYYQREYPKGSFCFADPVGVPRQPGTVACKHFETYKGVKECV